MSESSSSPPSRVVGILLGLGKVVVLTALSVGVNLALVYPELLRQDNQVAGVSALVSQLQTEVGAHQLMLDSHTANLSSLSAELERVSGQQDAVSQQFEQLTQRLQAVKDEAEALRAALGSQKERHNQLGKQLKQLSIRQQRQSERLTASVEGGVVATPSTSQPASTASTAKHEPAQAPITLHDVQLRGAAYVAVVSPRGANSLADVELLRRGETFLGWRIVSVLPGSVLLEKQGKRLTLRGES